MQTRDWRWHSVIAATALVAAQWMAVPACAQTLPEPANASVELVASAAPTENAADPAEADSSWRRYVGASGIVSYVDRQSLTPQVEAGAPTVHFRLLRNVLPDFTIKTPDGQPIRSSVKQVVLDCMRHSYTVITQTLYRARNASGKPLYQIHYGDEAQSRPLHDGSVFDWIAGRFCGTSR